MKSLLAWTLVCLSPVVALAQTSMPASRVAAKDAKELLAMFASEVQAELAPRMDQMTVPELIAQADRLAVTILRPQRDLLGKRAKVVLEELPRTAPIDPAGYMVIYPPAGRSADASFLGKKVADAPVGLLLLQYWNPVEAAQSARRVLMANVAGREIYAKQTLLDSLAPPTVKVIDPDATKPVLAVITGGDVMILSMERTNDGTYVDRKIQWLTPKPATASGPATASAPAKR